jgi:hypothetical protein
MVVPGQGLPNNRLMLLVVSARARSISSGSPFSPSRSVLILMVTVQELSPPVMTSDPV